MPNGRCRLHGGKSAAGIASATFRNGRYSKYVPARLSDRFEVALKDETMLEQRREIALLEIRINDLLDLLGVTGPRDVFKQLTELWTAFRHYANKQKKDKANEKIYELDTLIMGAHDESKLWQQVEQTVETRRRVVESERKRIIEAQEFVTLQQSLTLARALVESINKHIKNDRIKQLIQADIIAIYDR